jgi:hypothetical protein
VSPAEKPEGLWKRSQRRARRGKLHTLGATPGSLHAVVADLGDLPRWEMDALLAIADRLCGFTLASVRKPRGACLAIARAAMLEARRLR